jgi:hypothetical protein
METWYMLFDGESEDGRGEGEYHSRTTSKQKAMEFYSKIESNLYSVGYVLIVTDKACRKASSFTDWGSL